MKLIASAAAAVLLAALPLVAQEAPTTEATKLRAAVLRIDRQALPPVSRLDAVPENLGFAGATLATEDNATTGRFMGQEFVTDTVAASPENAVQALDGILGAGTKFVTVLADDATTLALADRARETAPDALIFNALAQGDNLRNADCRANVIHVTPSRAMLADALTQFLMWKKWGRWVLMSGSHPSDQALKAAYQASAKKFNAKIVVEKEFADTGGSRRSDTGHVLVQRQIPVDTQFGEDYDVLIAADENQVFAGYLPFQTWDARPVAGSAGLRARLWSPALESWGATQFQNRFEKSTRRPMRDEDYSTWLALRMLGEAATRTGSTDPMQLKQYILSPDFAVAGFKGEKMTIRDWDHQLRQPILLATDNIVVSVSPQEGYLHQVSQLDTLGTDRPETACKLDKG
ncbi:ABC transporter substrate-binding protein [Paracoccus sp. S1E-3]|uniref:ABC transporter substrate-binding protein n=1 Tax=Paracoccus sp. S1E-3 TaxID=2756130 RepID=UPI0015EE7DA1|nr:ABC transporter substrate-binding protein [Paracoccus sp. S1E-3]MBA4491127.1 ABC transporter substrate-binding protein [Paracoccus sp. S1E-3]